VVKLLAVELSPDIKMKNWLKSKNPESAAVRREREEDWR
jgi:hypothetical protein